MDAPFKPTVLISELQQNEERSLRTPRLGSENNAEGSCWNDWFSVSSPSPLERLLGLIAQ